MTQYTFDKVLAALAGGGDDGPGLGRVPGAAQLRSQMDSVRDEVLSRPQDLYLRSRMPEIYQRVRNANDIWHHRKLPREWRLEHAALELTNAMRLATEVALHLRPRPPRKGEVGPAITALEQAKDLIVEGWCQGAQAREGHSDALAPPNSPRAKRWSLEGALHAAATSNRPAMAAMWGFAAKAIGCSPDSPQAFARWNDAPGRTRGEVLLALDTAIHFATEWARGHKA